MTWHTARWVLSILAALFVGLILIAVFAPSPTKHEGHKAPLVTTTSPTSVPPPAAVPTPSEVAPPAYYASCADARAAGAAPLVAGGPGYRIELDRDGDGVACEG
jgi:hypothetical protein